MLALHNLDDTFDGAASIESWAFYAILATLFECRPVILIGTRNNVTESIETLHCPPFFTVFSNSMSKAYIQ